MSSTENESGPFVVFFLPAVVGCLTILLARRWANSQVNGTTSTGISRRRKIIKDPSVKRPLPTLSCKMVAPSSKKSGASKKGSVSASDEDANIAGKRANRATRAAPAVPSTVPNTVSETKQPDMPSPPKHIPFPYIPQDGELLFESMTFVFGLVATGLQFLNLYRTTWWVPNSFTNDAMKFYMIDPHLLVFIVTVLIRRLLLGLNMALFRSFVSKNGMSHAASGIRMFVLGVVVGALAWCAYFIAVRHSTIKLFFLCYPVVIYTMLFGLETAPFLELSNSETPPLHSCSHDPQHIRSEVDTLRQDFNLRIKKILFNSVVDAYYSSFIPCCFAQSYLYYDVYAAAQQVAVVWGGSFARYAAQLVSASYCDVSHRATLHMGQWKLHRTRIDENSIVSGWWWRGEGDVKHYRFYRVFINPAKLLCLLVCLQLSLILLQLILLFSNIHWHNFIAMAILLFINYYTLFKSLRDYLVAWKVYKAEYMIQDKNAALSAQHISN